LYQEKSGNPGTNVPTGGVAYWHRLRLGRDRIWRGYTYIGRAVIFVKKMTVVCGKMSFFYLSDQPKLVQRKSSIWLSRGTT
jgi:hypothetical protein